LAGLGGDLSGHGEQIGQVVDRPVQPPAAAAADRVPVPGRGEPDGLGVRGAQRPAGVAQQRLGLGRGAFGQPGQLAGDSMDRGLSLVAGLARASAAWTRSVGLGDPRNDCDPAAIPQPGAGGAPGALHPPGAAAIGVSALARSLESVG